MLVPTQVSFVVETAAQPFLYLHPVSAQPRSLKSMSTDVVVKRIAGASPRLKARIAGVFEALEGFASSQGQVLILGRLVVAGSAAATAANIL
jgi:hypothetical protein